jgi:predicted component of type VI protein secretion system
MNSLRQRASGTRDRIKPCLLLKLAGAEAYPRLGDVEPSRGLNAPQYIQSVCEDLRRLFSSRAPGGSLPLVVPEKHRRFDSSLEGEASGLTFGDFPEAQRSVIGFGLPDFTGLTRADLADDYLVGLLAATIRAFEPRINPDTLRVTLLNPQGSPEVEPPEAGPEHAATGRLSQAVLRFRVTGTLWTYPEPEWVSLQTEIDLDDGVTSVTP